MNLRSFFKYVPPFLSLAVTFLFPLQAFSLIFTVNTTMDAVDLNPGDGVCDINPSPFITLCSLRAAIQEANAILNSHELIQLPPGTYQLSIPGSDDSGAIGDLDITDGVTIESTSLDQNAAEITIVDGGDKDRVFHIHGTNSKKTEVYFYDFTIQNGQARGGTGGGGGILSRNAILQLVGMRIRSNDVLGGDSHNNGGGLCFLDTDSQAFIRRSIFEENSAYSGGGIRIGGSSSLVMTDTTIHNNYAVNVGGGIHNHGAMDISNSTISGNGAKNVGGISNYNRMKLSNVTISGNRATGGDYYGSSGQAAALRISYDPPTPADAPLLHNCTFFGNMGQNSIILTADSQAELVNTVIASKIGIACFNSTDASYTSESNNLSSDDTCNFVHASDIINADPKLGPLADNGGRTLTHLPQPGSLLINAGLNSNQPELLTDQRGMSRPQGSRYDIGAVEVKQCSYYPIKNRFGTLNFICL